tara:strand:- start:253 stop:501 length:249 start_codon:yes stop_codon:yes gene_type:complete
MSSYLDNRDMKYAALIGLLFALVMGMIAVTQVSTLQDEGESIAGGVGSLFGVLTPLTLIMVVGGIGIGLVIGAVMIALGRWR